MTKDEEGSNYYVVLYSKGPGKPIIFSDDFTDKGKAVEGANKIYGLHPEWMVFVHPVRCIK